MNDPTETLPAQPWYRHRWPWLLMLPPLLSMVGGFSLLYLAVSTPNALVVDDYAQIAKHTERRLERDREAAMLGLRGRLAAGAGIAGSGRLSLEFEFDAAPAAVPERLTLRLLHPTLEQLDREVVLVRGGDSYRGVVEDAASPRYYVLVEPEDRRWRLTGEMTGEGTLSLAPPINALAGAIPDS